jgi:polar amino acid transport system permease protein
MAKLPGIDGRASTDLPVLNPLPRHFTAGAVHKCGPDWYRLELRPWHGWLLLAAFVMVAAVAEAQSSAPLDRSPLATLYRWIPFIVWQNGNGFVLNLTISFFAMAIGTVLGAILGLLRVSLYMPVRGGSWFVTQFFRNSPWLVLLFCIMLLMPYEISIGGELVRIPDWMKAVIGFSLPIMANIAEIVRGAVQSIPTGQWESAESLAFSRRQTMWMIIFPQCIKRMIPPWMNWYAILTMSTPVASVLGVEESVYLAAQAMVAEDSRPELLGPFYGFLLVIFFLYCYPIAKWTMHLERKFEVNG